MLLNLVVIATLLAGDAAAQQVGPVAKPFQRLFHAKAIGSQGRASSYPPGVLRSPSSPRVVCGLTVWEVDPNLDRKIRLPQSDQKPDYKIRRLNPPICSD
jgi:hypothetical protein